MYTHTHTYVYIYIYLIMDSIVFSFFFSFGCAKMENPQSVVLRIANLISLHVIDELKNSALRFSFLVTRPADPVVLGCLWTFADGRGSRRRCPKEKKNDDPEE